MYKIPRVPCRLAVMGSKRVLIDQAYGTRHKIDNAESSKQGRIIIVSIALAKRTLYLANTRLSNISM